MLSSLPEFLRHLFDHTPFFGNPLLIQKAVIYQLLFMRTFSPLAIAEIGEKPFGARASIYFAVIAKCLVKFQLKRSWSNPVGLHFSESLWDRCPNLSFWDISLLLLKYNVLSLWNTTHDTPEIKGASWNWQMDPLLALGNFSRYLWR